jgi:glycosyltransferase involved in cell wall biosynthesis
MRVAFITTEYVTEEFFSGGVANYTHRVARTLVSMGHDIHVVVNSDKDPEEFSHEGIRVHRVRKGKIGVFVERVASRFMGQAIGRIILSFNAFLKLRSIHKRNPIDMLQVTELFGCGLISSLLLPVPHCVVISSYRPETMKMRGEPRNLDNRLVELLELIQMKTSRNLHTMSLRLKRTLETQAGIKRIKIIPPPFFVEALESDTSVCQDYLKGKEYVLYFGRYELHKGFHILVKALPGFLEENRDAYAVFVGQDRPTKIAESMREYAISTCSKYKDRMIFLDQLPHSKLYPIISNAKLIALPSLVDNIPNVCLEAMGLAKPVIGTFEASYDEVITDNVNGFLVHAGDVEALKEKLLQAWQRPDLEEIGNAAKERSKDFAPEIIVKELVDYFRSVCGLNDDAVS